MAADEQAPRVERMSDADFGYVRKHPGIYGKELLAEAERARTAEEELKVRLDDACFGEMAACWGTLGADLAASRAREAELAEALRHERDCGMCNSQGCSCCSDCRADALLAAGAKEPP